MMLKQVIKFLLFYFSNGIAFFEVEDFRDNINIPFDKNKQSDDEFEEEAAYLYDIGNSCCSIFYDLGLAYHVVKLDTVKEILTIDILNKISPLLSEDEISYYTKFVSMNKFNL